MTPIENKENTSLRAPSQPRVAWFYIKDNERHGPYTPEQMIKLYLTEVIEDRTPCWSPHIEHKWISFTLTELSNNKAVKTNFPIKEKFPTHSVLLTIGFTSLTALLIAVSGTSSAHPDFGMNANEFKNRVNIAIAKDVINKKNINSWLLVDCKQANNVETCRFGDGTFYENLKEKQALLLSFPGVKYIAYLNIYTNSKHMVTSVTVGGTRSDFSTTAYMVGNVVNVMDAINPSIYPENLLAFSINTGIQRGDDDPTTGTPIVSTNYHIRSSCMVWPSRVSHAIECTLSPEQ
jgi:GYF domain 2